MDTDKLLKIAQKVVDRAASDPEFVPALGQLKRLLFALEQGKASDPTHAFKILSAAIILDIMADPANNSPYDKNQIDIILGDLGTDEGPAEEDPLEPIGEGESTDPYLEEKINKIQEDLGLLAKGLEQIKYEEVSKGTVKAIDQDFVEFLNNVSCQIKIKSKNKDRRLSGCLVSHDGSVLTCAHNLTTDPIQIKFASGVNKGTYKADKVHVDKKKDIAPEMRGDLARVNLPTSVFSLQAL